MLTPEDDQGLSAALRLALAQRMARLNQDSALEQAYQHELAQLQPADELLALAEGALPAGEPLATIVCQPAGV
ncbi:hypothetical protein CRX72_04180 [Pantoea sp. BRM17]|nr:hypothetical protein CRX72_04180 [Pantoea sp. BRM17]